MELTLLEAEGDPRPFAARVDAERVVVDGATLTALTGWTRRPEGLCRDDRCVPVRDPELDRDGGVDLARWAAAVGRPAVVDAGEGVVALGVASAERRGPMEAGVAPDFTLPTLDGGSFTLSSVGRRKKALVAWASW